MKKKPDISERKNLRAEAERILKNRVSEVPPENTSAMKLLHELSVHQIELELQNEELRESRDAAAAIAEKYTELYDFAPAGYFTLTHEGKIAELNLNAARLLGRERSKLIKAGFEYFLDREYKKAFRDFLTEVFQSNMSKVCDIMLSNSTYLRLSGLADQDFCKITALDITSLKEAEKKNELLLKQLKEAKQKLDLALENANIGNWELRLEPKEMILSERMSKILGLDTSLISFRDFLELVHDEDSARVARDFSDSLEKSLPLETVFRINSKENKQKYISCKGVYYRNSKDSFSGISGVCIDITRIHESSEQSLTKLNEKLVRSNKDLENFAYVASHDLQEPLRMVSSFTQLLEKQYGEHLDDRAHEYISYAVQGAKRMYDLLNSLLTYSRIQTSREQFNEIDLNEVLHKVKDNLQIIIKERKAVIETDRLPVVRASGGQMLQLLQNLIENAIKFTRADPHIVISAKRENGFHIISVKDNGIGIDRVYHERIFKIFQKLHANNEYPGTGIGLAVCKSIVERHEGTIWIVSGSGKGTTFFFTLPIRNE